MKRIATFLLVSGLGAGCNTQAKSTDIVAAGHVEATDVHISAKIPGRLTEAPLKEGDSVKAGALISKQDTTDLEITLRQVHADEAQANADLRLRIAGARKEDILSLIHISEPTRPY